MKLSEKLELAQSKAPSYIILLDDGAPMKCSECGRRDNGIFAKGFTPDGKSHSPIHLDCFDPEWIALATKMDFTV